MRVNLRRWMVACGAAAALIVGGLLAQPAELVPSAQRTSGPTRPDPPLKPEPIQMRLLRSIYTGTLQGVSSADVDRLTTDSQVDFATASLARAVRRVRGRDPGFPEWPITRLLDRGLSLMPGSSNALIWSAELPHGFGGDDFVYALVYALSIAGDADRAIQVLERHIASADVYKDYKRAVVLQALRNMGSARGDDLIRRAGAQGKDANLPENLLADLHYPFHLDLRQRWRLIPPEQRTRASLARVAAERCGERAALAVFLLGYFGEPAEPEAQKSELALLRDSTRAPCFHTRFHAVRALALRSPETLEFWLDRFRAERDAWQRAQLVRIMFARFGAEFLKPALGLLADEPSQYVQWELMHGNLEMRNGGRFRDYWDIWQTTTLQIRLTFPEGEGKARSEDMDEILDWLETGVRPRDRVVRNHLLYGTAKHVWGWNARRLLRVFDKLPEKTAQWWILAPLNDPEALPLLRYWLTLPKANDQQYRELESLVERLAAAGDGDRLPVRTRCCAPTRACLIEHLERSGTADEAVMSAEQASAWLAGNTEEAAITFLDPLERIASVVRRSGASPERWEHVFGCWTPVGPAQ